MNSYKKEDIDKLKNIGLSLIDSIENDIDEKDKAIKNKEQIISEIRNVLGKE